MFTSRREFVKLVTASGIALSLSRLAPADEPAFATRETLPGRGAWNPAATGRAASTGVAKITGAKLYASDFRAVDMPGWPATTSHAILIRAPDATHVYTGIDLARLSGALKPTVVVDAGDLARIGTRVPEFYAGDLFCRVGRTPLYLGQPVALLLFEQFDVFDRARLALRDGTFVRFGEETGPVRIPDYGAYRFTRVAGPTPEHPTSTRRSRRAGSVRQACRTRGCQSGLREPLSQVRPTRRPLPMASKSGPSSPQVTLLY